MKVRVGYDSARLNLNILASEAVSLKWLWPACYIRRLCLKIQKGRVYHEYFFAA